MFAPMDYSGEFAVPQNRFALCGFTFALGEGRRCRFMLRCWFYLMFGFYVLFGFVLHRLVGLRLLRLCLKLRRGFAPRPCNGFHPLTLTRGVPLDLLLASLGVLFYSILVICSVGYAHSSLLTPHSSFIPALSAIHRCYLRQSFRQSIIKLIKTFQSPLPICSHC